MFVDVTLLLSYQTNSQSYTLELKSESGRTLKQRFIENYQGNYNTIFCFCFFCLGVLIGFFMASSGLL